MIATSRFFINTVYLLENRFRFLCKKKKKKLLLLSVSVKWLTVTVMISELHNSLFLFSEYKITFSCVNFYHITCDKEKRFIPVLLFLTGAVGATNMNAHSSRSHAIFTITIECAERGVDGQQHWRVGKLHLVDLAVSVFCAVL